MHVKVSALKVEGEIRLVTFWPSNMALIYSVCPRLQSWFLEAHCSALIIVRSQLVITQYVLLSSVVVGFSASSSPRYSSSFEASSCL